MTAEHVSRYTQQVLDRVTSAAQKRGLTLEQRELRRTGIGASEIAAIVSMNPYASPLDVWLEKTGRAEPRIETEPEEWGLIMEPVILARYAERNQVELETPGTLRHPAHSIALATPDAIVLRDGQRERTLQAKNVGARQAWRWGDESDGPEAVPPEYYLQCQWEMFVTGLPVAHLAACLAGSAPKWYHIDFDPELAGWLLEAAQRFIRDHVDKDVCPPLDHSASARKYLARTFPKHSSEMVPADAEAELLARDLRQARRMIAVAEREKARAENLLRQVIGEREGIAGVDWRVTWRKTKDSAQTDWQALAVELGPTADLIKRHTRPIPGHRRFLCRFDDDETENT